MTHQKNHSQHHQQSKPKTQPHKDWRVWTAIILMLAAMFVYVMTDDESLQPGGATQAPVEAADGE